MYWPQRVKAAPTLYRRLDDCSWHSPSPLKRRMFLYHNQSWSDEDLSYPVSTSWPRWQKFLTCWQCRPEMLFAWLVFPASLLPIWAISIKLLHDQIILLPRYVTTCILLADFWESSVDIIAMLFVKDGLLCQKFWPWDERWKDFWPFDRTSDFWPELIRGGLLGVLTL